MLVCNLYIYYAYMLLYTYMTTSTKHKMNNIKYPRRLECTATVL